MPDGFRIDNSELNQLASSLGAVPATVGPFLKSAVTVTARNIKDDWRDEAKGMAHAPAFPYSVTYDVTTSAGIAGSRIEAEIGPDKDRAQGALGNLIEFGSIHNRAQGLGHGALKRNEADFERGLTRALSDAEKAAGVR